MLSTPRSIPTEVASRLLDTIEHPVFFDYETETQTPSAAQPNTVRHVRQLEAGRRAITGPALRD